MRVNPIVDLLAFLAGPSYGEPGFMAPLYWLVAAASLTVALIAMRRVPGQCAGAPIGRFVARFIIGSMWWQQALWKYPTNLDGLRYWTGQMAQHAAFAAHGAFVRDVVLPNLGWLGVGVFFLELAIGVSLMLGLLVRLSAAGGALFIANLWLGLYRVDAEWPWSYFFLILLLVIFSFDAYGRALGCDALIRAGEGWRRRLPGFLMRFT
ncbi:MAG: DoxX family membrane protein [Rhodospirillales bacterium]|nr:DoxX family membrane protein [Rhodospirillales bacterium]MDE2574952.1 DoxX family membrane protein [Rhodospirillales bacterium]